MLSRFVAIIVAITAFAVGAKPCLAQTKSVVVYQAEGETVDVTLPAWSSSHVTVVTNNNGASSAIAHVELALKTGFYKGGEVQEFSVSPSLGLSLKVSENCFLHGSAGVGLASNGTISDISLGLGAWATDHLRFILSGGQVVSRTNSWLWIQGGPGGKLAIDYFMGSNAFLGLEVFGGPSWDKDNRLSGSFMSKLGLGWRF